MKHRSALQLCEFQCLGAWKYQQEVLAQSAPLKRAARKNNQGYSCMNDEYLWSLNTGGNPQLICTRIEIQCHDAF